jgi:DNA-binding response OmpR family regulator
LDLALNEPSAAEICARIREESLVPILLMASVQDAEGTLMEGLRLGADEVLEKSVSDRLLRGRVVAYLRRVYNYDWPQTAAPPRAKMAGGQVTQSAGMNGLGGGTGVSEAERERAARERTERELAAREKAARELAERERLAREHAERELADRERITRELAERERAARQQAERERAERERLAREQAARETAERDKLVRELAAQAEALTAAVKAAQQMPQVAGAVPAPVRRSSSRVLRRPKPQRKPQKKGGQLQDEWGLYDPGAAGFEALYARLEQQEAGQIVEPEPATAAELLMDAPAAGAASAAKKRKKRRKPAPLAMWVRHRAEATPAATTAPAGFALDTLIDELNLPGGVASVAYPRTCQVHRVRVKRSGRRPKPGTRGKRKALIILSRKVLDTLRPHTVRRLRLGDVEKTAA